MPLGVYEDDSFFSRLSEFQFRQLHKREEGDLCEAIHFQNLFSVLVHFIDIKLTFSPYRASYLAACWLYSVR